MFEIEPETREVAIAAMRRALERYGELSDRALSDAFDEAVTIVFNQFGL